MLPSVAAWTLAIIFVTAGLEKLLGRQARQDFMVSARTIPILGSAPTAYMFLISELLALPLLFFHSQWGLNLLVGLCALVNLWAVVAWRRGEIESCGCGGIWAADGRNLFFRNGALLLMAIYARLTAPTPLVSNGLAYAVGVILAFLVVAGIVEAIRIRIRTG